MVYKEYKEYDNRGYDKGNRESISRPRVRDFKGNKVLDIPFGRDNQPWGFGYTKAKAILNYLEDIKTFVSEIEQQKVEAGKDGKDAGRPR